MQHIFEDVLTFMFSLFYAFKDVFLSRDKIFLFT